MFIMTLTSQAQVYVHYEIDKSGTKELVMISNFSSIVCAVQCYTLPFNAVHAVYVHYDVDKSGTKEREFPRSFS